MDTPADMSNITGFIITSRQNGYHDSEIRKHLIEAKWPEDVIGQALAKASETIQPVPEEPESEPQVAQDGSGQNTSAAQPAEKDQHPQQPAQPESKHQKKGFSIISVIALIISPIPFFGLGLAMSALDDVRKNNKSGFIFAVLALIISIGSVLVLLWIMFRLLSAGPGAYQNLAERLNEWFGIID